MVPKQILILSFLGIRDLPIELRQPDRDFQADRMKSGLLRAKHDYVIFIDGDCLLPPNFVRNPGVSQAEDSLRKSSTPGMNVLLLSKESRIDTNCLFSNYKFKAIPFGPLRDIDPFSW